MKVAVVATLTVKDGKNAEFEAIFHKAQSLVRTTEPGVLTYELTRSRENPNDYKIVELYRDEDAFKVHGKAEGFGEVVQALPAVVAASKLETLDVID